jgi:DNA-binding NtrC family response regulator
MSHNGTPSSATLRLAGRVAVHSADARSLSQLAAVLTRQGHNVFPFSQMEQLRAALLQESFSVCVVDEPESLEQVVQMQSAVHDRGGTTQFVVMPALGAAHSRSETPDGIEVLEPPHTPERIGRALFAAIGRSQRVSENLDLKQQQMDGRIWQQLIGHTSAMNDVRNRLREFAECDAPVLFRGEPGTGATMLAGLLHSARCADGGQLLSVRCQVLSTAAAEEAIFGDPGLENGRIAAAAGGTLLLDDIDGLSLPVQRRLAAFLASCRHNPDHADTEPAAVAHIVATTHANLEQLVREGRFDAELYRHFHGGHLELPALCDRTDDIVPLAEHFLAEFAAREGRPVQQFSTDALRVLKSHAWPGNVRELENVVSRCCALENGPVLTAEVVSTWVESQDEMSPDHPGLTLREMERKLIETTFARFHGNRELTARALRIGLRTLSGKLREYGYPPRGGPGSNRIQRAA